MIAGAVVVHGFEEGFRVYAIETCDLVAIEFAIMRRLREVREG
jgi:hypothetical protein